MLCTLSALSRALLIMCLFFSMSLSVSLLLIVLPLNILNLQNNFNWTSKSCHLYMYFNRIVRLWNKLPFIDLLSSIPSLLPMGSLSSPF